MASCSFWVRCLLPPRMATCVHTRHMGLTSWHIPGSGASRGEEGHRTRGKATGQRSKEKGSEVNVHRRSPLRRVSGGQGRGRGSMREASRTWSVLALGCRHTPILSSPQRRGNQGSKAEFRPLALASVGTTLLWSWGIGVPACPQAPGRTSTRGCRGPCSGLWLGVAQHPQQGQGLQPRAVCLEGTRFLPPGERGTDAPFFPSL